MRRLLALAVLALFTTAQAWGQVSVAVGSKAKPTGAAPATDATTGLSFQPKIVFFGMSENSILSADAAGAAATVGVGRTTSERFSTSWNSADNVATTNTDRRYLNTAAIYSLDSGGSTAAIADLASLDSDGFTLTWDPNDSNATLYNYLAIGGASITAKITEQTLSTSTGNVTYAHSLGATPSVIFVLHANRTTAGTSGSIVHSFGVATATDQWVLANYGINGTATAADMDAQSYGRTTQVLARLGAGGAVNFECAFVSMDATNVTLNQTGTPTADLFALVAIAGGSWKAGATAKTIGAEPAADTIASSLGFEPKGAILATHGLAASSSVQANAGFSLGFASEAAETAYGAYYDDAVLNTQADSRLNNTRSVVILTPTSGAVTISAELDASLDANGITGTWQENHATASQILWLAFGDAATGAAVHQLHNRRRRQ